jgi:hypothetical protein
MFEHLNDEQKTYLKWGASFLGGLIFNQAGAANVTKVAIGSLITKGIIDYIDEYHKDQEKPE